VNFPFYKKICFLFVILTFSQFCSATFGYYPHGFGTKNKAMGGAGSAYPQDALIAATNPAGMIFVGEREDMAVDFLVPSRGYQFEKNSIFGTFNLDQEVTSSGAVFPLPTIGFTFPFENKGMFGLTIYGAGSGAVYSEKDTATIDKEFLDELEINGDTITKEKLQQLCAANAAFCQLQLLGVEIPSESDPDNTPVTIYGSPIQGTFLNGDAGADLLLILVNGNYSQKISAHSSWGMGINLAIQSFQSHGLETFKPLSNDVENVTDNGRSWGLGLGVSFGALVKILPYLDIAASYQSKIKITHDTYKGLLSNKGNLDVPPMMTLGLAYTISENVVFLLDVQKIWWTDSPSFSNKLSSLINPADVAAGLATGGSVGGNQLGSTTGPGFGWQDSTALKTGLQWKFSEFLPQWTWRAGYAWHQQIVPETETLFGVLAPAVVTNHITFGFSKRIDSIDELNIAFLWAPKKIVEGTGVSQGINIHLQEFAVEVSWGTDIVN
jgi:long-chain fatty acid transport protein